MKVLVLGCGPAGLIATHAAAMGNHDVVVAGVKRKSEMYGCQYLHKPIPLITNGPGIDVEYRKMGTPKQYREKVYGPDQRFQSSAETLETNHQAWDIRAAYHKLWSMYGRYVIDRKVGPAFEGVQDLITEADVVFSSIPASTVCHNENHTFKSEEVWAVGDAPERGVFAPAIADEYTVVCNGLESPAWYRAANVFGYHTVEWPGAMSKPPFEGVVRIAKPLRTDCDCNPAVERIGRFGRWQKGYLTHDVLEQVETRFEGPWRLF